MNDQEMCETCKYWQSYRPVTSEDQTGTCARFPPVLVQPMVRALIGEKADYMSVFRAINEDSSAWSQPITTALGYCGEWKKID